MPKQPTLTQILDEFEREAEQAVRFVSVHRDLLLRVCREMRRLMEKEAANR